LEETLARIGTSTAAKGGLVEYDQSSRQSAIDEVIRQLRRGTELTSEKLASIYSFLAAIRSPAE
jgi:hypothetical protein